MRKFISLGVLILLTSCSTTPPSSLPTPIPQSASLQNNTSLKLALKSTEQFLNKKSAEQMYEKFGWKKNDLNEQRNILKKLKELSLLSPEEFKNTFPRVFQLDCRTPSIVSAYAIPEVEGRNVRGGIFQYPLYGFTKKYEKYSRKEIEGKDGKGALPDSQALIFLPSYFDVLTAQTQGSILLRTPEKFLLRYQAHTDQPYIGLGSELVKDGFMTKGEVSLQKIKSFFDIHPELLPEYVQRNNRVVFFQKAENQEIIGSLNVPLVPESSVALDKKTFPPGSIGVLLFRNFYPTQLVFDHDSGGAIKDGRVDLYLGSGNEALSEAGVYRREGQFCKLILR
jgi:membrane-bound lytic murein transglycosylase A